MCNKGRGGDYANFNVLDHYRQLFTTGSDQEMSMKYAKIIALVVLLSGINVPAGFAQENGCTAEELSGPPRVIYHCPNGLVVEAEALAELGFANSAGHGFAGPETVSEGAVLIELKHGGVPFQISTPYAIASVRGTVFIVDAQPLRTSVFVVRGVVMVSRPDGSSPVELGMGDGVDVSPDKPLNVLHWSNERVSVLLARFAR